MTQNQHKIEKLISELCPNGIEFKELGELGYFFGGLTGKSKEDFTGGNAKFITYMNIASNIAINTNITTFVKIKDKENQNRIEYGDVLFTGSSETPNEVGLSSVLVQTINEPLYLNSFCFGFRLNNRSIFLPGFLKYLFRDEQTRKQIIKTASGVTRFNVSKKRFAKIKIPIPPLPIQEEIVKILDTFTELEAELEAELQARKKQYEYYINDLFRLENANHQPLGEIGHFTRGKRFVKNDILEEGFPCIHYGEMYTHYNVWTEKTKSFISPDLASRLRTAHYGDVILVAAGETIEDIGNAVAWLGNSDVIIHDACFAFSHKLNPKFVSYFFRTNNFRSQIKRYVSSGKVSAINDRGLAKAIIPIPSDKEQERIVSILDKFDALVNDISIGLPAELEARRKQYEYYRNKLLTFEPLSNV